MKNKLIHKKRYTWRKNKQLCSGLTIPSLNQVKSMGIRSPNAGALIYGICLMYFAPF